MAMPARGLKKHPSMNKTKRINNWIIIPIFKMKNFGDRHFLAPRQVLPLELKSIQQCGLKALKSRDGPPKDATGALSAGFEPALEPMTRGFTQLTRGSSSTAAGAAGAGCAAGFDPSSGGAGLGDSAGMGFDSGGATIFGRGSGTGCLVAGRLRISGTPELMGGNGNPGAGSAPERSTGGLIANSFSASKRRPSSMVKLARILTRSDLGGACHRQFSTNPEVKSPCFQLERIWSGV